MRYSKRKQLGVGTGWARMSSGVESLLTISLFTLGSEAKKKFKVAESEAKLGNKIDFLFVKTSLL